MAPRKMLRHPVLLTSHVFDKLRAIDLGLAEFEVLLGSGDVIEEHVLDAAQLKELVLLVDWSRPLHVVVVVDEKRREERIITVYEPDRSRWSDDYRKRRR